VPALRGGKARPRVHFDEISFTEDVWHATAAGRRVAIDARRDLERDGVDIALLLSCQAHGRDGTRLPRCVKLICRLREGAGGWCSRSRAIGQAVIWCLPISRSGSDTRRSRGSRRPTGSPTSDCTPPRGILPTLERRRARRIRARRLRRVARTAIQAPLQHCDPLTLPGDRLRQHLDLAIHPQQHLDHDLAARVKHRLRLSPIHTTRFDKPELCPPTN
jgi:hypothetical protein